MEITIKNKKQNDLLRRNEIAAVIKAGVAPTMQEAGNLLAKNLNADAELVVVKRVIGKFGRDEFEVEAYVYENKEVLQKVEPKSKAKKEETKTQEPNEEVKPEKKEEGQTEKKEKKTQEKPIETAEKKEDKEEKAEQKPGAKEKP